MGLTGILETNTKQGKRLPWKKHYMNTFNINLPFSLYDMVLFGSYPFNSCK